MLTKITVHVEAYVDGRLVYTDRHMSFELDNASLPDYTQALDLLAGRNVSQLIRSTITEQVAKMTPPPALPQADTKPKTEENQNAPANAQAMSVMRPDASPAPVSTTGTFVPFVQAGPPQQLGNQLAPPVAGSRQAQPGGPPAGKQ